MRLLPTVLKSSGRLFKLLYFDVYSPGIFDVQTSRTFTCFFSTNNKSEAGLQILRKKKSSASYTCFLFSGDDSRSTSSPKERYRNMEYEYDFFVMICCPSMLTILFDITSWCYCGIISCNTVIACRSFLFHILCSSACMYSLH